MTVIQLDLARSTTPQWTALLSPREAEVMRLVATGQTNAEIAAELFIGVATVKTHVAQLLRKVRVRDRVALVVAAYSDGFVRVEPGGVARPRCSTRIPRQQWRS